MAARITDEHGEYCVSGDLGVLYFTKEIAFAYDVDGYIMMKWGMSESIKEWVEKAKIKYKNAGDIGAMLALNLRIVTFYHPYPPEKLHRIIDTTGFLKFIVEGIESNEVREA